MARHEKRPMPGPVYYAAWLGILILHAYAVRRLLSFG